jgi:hypothetical protein
MVRGLSLQAAFGSQTSLAIPGVIETPLTAQTSEAAKTKIEQMLRDYIRLYGEQEGQK